MNAKQEIRGRLWDELEDVSNYMDDIRNTLSNERWKPEEVADYAKALYYFTKARRVILDQLDEE